MIWVLNTHAGHVDQMSPTGADSEVCWQLEALVMICSCSATNRIVHMYINSIIQRLKYNLYSVASDILYLTFLNSLPDEE